MHVIRIGKRGGGEDADRIAGLRTRQCLSDERLPQCLCGAGTLQQTSCRAGTTTSMMGHSNKLAVWFQMKYSQARKPELCIK